MLWRVGKTLWLRAQPCMSDAWYVRLLTVASNQFNSWTQSVKWSSRTRTPQWQRIYFKKFGRLHKLFSKIRPSYCEAKILRQGPALQLPPDFSENCQFVRCIVFRCIWLHTSFIEYVCANASTYLLHSTQFTSCFEDRPMGPVLYLWQKVSFQVNGSVQPQGV